MGSTGLFAELLGNSVELTQGMQRTQENLSSQAETAVHNLWLGAIPLRRVATKPDGIFFTLERDLLKKKEFKNLGTRQCWFVQLGDVYVAVVFTQNGSQLKCTQWYNYSPLFSVVGE